jgi:hypothetical protein
MISVRSVTAPWTGTDGSPVPRTLTDGRMPPDRAYRLVRVRIAAPASRIAVVRKTAGDH